MVKSRVKNKKNGISTFIATLLLIVLVVAAGVLIYAYLMGYLGGATLMPEKHTMQIQSIAEVQGQLLLYVKNIGTGSLKLDPLGNSNARIYVDDVRWSYDIVEHEFIEKLPEGKTCTLTMAIDYVKWGGKTIYIKLIADDGTIAQTSYRISGTYVPALLDHFEFNSITSPQIAGVPLRVIISALDQYGSLFNYNEMNTLTYSGGTVTPATCTFIGGVWTEFVTLEHEGVNVFLSTTGGGKSGQSNPFNVNPGSAATLTVTGFPSPVTAGTAGSVTVTAKDAYGNTATGYTGTVQITSSDIAATLPANYAFVAGDNGFHTFTNGVTLTTAGTQSISATDTVTSSITGSQTGIQVIHTSTVSSIAVTPDPATITAPATQAYTAIATDTYGNTWDVSTLATWGITPAAGGLWSTNVYTSAKAGTWTVTGTYSGQSDTAQLTVNHASAVSSIAVTPLTSSITAGGTQTYTATASDVYLNTWDITSLTAWSISSGAGGSWAANVYTSAKVSPVGTPWTVTGTYSAISGTAQLTVNPGVLASFVFSVISSPQTAGTPITGVTITAVDINGNTVTSYASSTALTETDGGAGGSVTPPSVTFASGSWSGSLTLTKSGTGVTITATGGGQSGKSNAFTVNPGAFAGFTITGYPTTVTQYQPFGGVVVNACDANNNRVPSYTGQVYFTATGSGAYTLPYTSGNRYTFVIGDAGSHTFLGFSFSATGSKTITVTDGTRSAVTSTITVVATGSLRYSVSMNPTASPTSASTSYTYTVTRQSPVSGSPNLGYVKVQIPAGFTAISVTSVTASNLQTWIADPVTSNTITIHAQAAAGELTTTGQYVTLVFSATAPASAGVYGPLVSTAYQSYAGGGSPGQLYNSVDPSITVYNLPVSPILETQFEGATWLNGWAQGSISPPWHHALAPEGYSGTDCSSSYSSDDGGFTSEPRDASNANVILISFKYKVHQTETADLLIQYQNHYDQDPDLSPGTTDFTTISNIGSPSQGQDVWVDFSYTLTRSLNPNAFTSTFRLRFESYLNSGEQVWVDNVLVSIAS